MRTRTPSAYRGRSVSGLSVTGQAAYHLTDAAGSTVGLADPTGAITTSYTYEPFGRTTVSGTASTNPFRFTGREEDSTGALALYHYRARYYSPTLQRFLTEDPIGFAGGDANLYGYVGNAPTVWTDPSGLVGWPPVGPPYEGGGFDPVEWLWDRLVDGGSWVQDSWSKARKDWAFRAEQLQRATEQLACGEGVTGRLIQFFSWAPPSPEGKTIAKGATTVAFYSARVLDWMGREAFGLQRSFAFAFAARVWVPLNLGSTLIDLAVCS